MKNLNDIIKKLDDLSDPNTPLQDIVDDLQLIKKDFVINGNQEEAKRIWIFQTVVKVHILYREAFEFIKNRKYYDGWCKLEEVEIEIGFLKKHFKYNETEYLLYHIEKTTNNLQVLFPYKLFVSSEILIKEEICNICNKKVSVRTPCGHIVGEIYDGELCTRTISKCSLLGCALVTNPQNKYSVLFHKDKTSGKQVDLYDYSIINFLFERISDPYENWDLKVYKKEITADSYGEIDPDDPCLCGSGRRFKECCALNIGKFYPHYELIIHRNDTNKS